MNNMNDMNYEFLACPTCRSSLTFASLQNLEACTSCGQIFLKAADSGNGQNDSKGPKWTKWIDLCATEDRINISTEAAYKIYSKYYAPFALLAYLLIWRGRFLRHVGFFREMLHKSQTIVDLATGDGSLTSFALFGSRKTRIKKLIAVDISGGMLERAYKKLPRNTTLLLRGDVCQLPFLDRSVLALSCFGGLNSFPSGGKALKEMARCLSPDGILRGSVLLMPQSPWRQRLVLDWIRKGYQTEEVTEDKFRHWVKESGLEFSQIAQTAQLTQVGQRAQIERHGDVLLFELRHPVKPIPETLSAV